MLRNAPVSGHICAPSEQECHLSRPIRLTDSRVDAESPARRGRSDGRPGHPGRAQARRGIPRGRDARRALQRPRRLSELRPDVVLVDEMCQRTNAMARSAGGARGGARRHGGAALGQPGDRGGRGRARRRRGRGDLATCMRRPRHAAARASTTTSSTRRCPRDPAAATVGDRATAGRGRAHLRARGRSAAGGADQRVVRHEGVGDRARRRGRPTAGSRTASAARRPSRTSARSRGSSPSSAFVPCVSVIVRSVEARSV